MLIYHCMRGIEEEEEEVKEIFLDLTLTRFAAVFTDPRLPTSELDEEGEEKGGEREELQVEMNLRRMLVEADSRGMADGREKGGGGFGNG